VSVWLSTRAVFPSIRYIRTRISRHLLVDTHQRILGIAFEWEN